MFKILKHFSVSYFICDNNSKYKVLMVVILIYVQIYIFLNTK